MANHKPRTDAQRQAARERLLTNNPMSSPESRAKLGASKRKRSAADAMAELREAASKAAVLLARAEDRGHD